MKKLWILTSIVLMLTMAACSGNNSGKKEEKPEQGSSQKGIKVAVVVNQKFGDNGPMDDIAKGTDRAEKDFGVTVKKLESESAAKFEEDVRAMSADYDLVITTFPYMSDATKLVAKEYPDTKYAAVFQFINNNETSISNIWDTEFHGEQAFYLSGYMAGKLTKSGNIGLVIGGEEPTPNAEGNGFMKGVKDANPAANVEFAFVGSYEDPAKAKEITKAMISKGCDVIQTNSGSSNAGVIEAAKEANVLCCGEITDFYDNYKGFYGVVGIGFGDTVYKAIEMVVNGSFEGGKHGIRDLENGGYFMAWDTFERFASENTEYGEVLKKAIAEAKELEEKIKTGSLEIPFDTEVPNWANH